MTVEHTHDDRKARERHFHDHFRGELQANNDAKYLSYQKWYAAGHGSTDWLYGWLRTHAPGKRVLDYACGAGHLAVTAAGMGADVVGIDLSERSIQLAQQRATEAGVTVDFRVMDAEQTDFAPASFDIIVCNGVLHHMDLDYAYAELARLLKPAGTVIALEALGHNPFINWYRRRTPYLRSPDEHPLHVDDLERARRYFARVDVRYFNLLTLAAGPLWKTPLCRPVAWALGYPDAILLHIPGVQRWAWMAGLLLTAPRPGRRG